MKKSILIIYGDKSTSNSDLFITHFKKLYIFKLKEKGFLEYNGERNPLEFYKEKLTEAYGNLDIYSAIKKEYNFILENENIDIYTLELKVTDLKLIGEENIEEKPFLLNLNKGVLEESSNNSLLVNSSLFYFYKMNYYTEEDNSRNLHYIHSNVFQFEFKDIDLNLCLYYSFINQEVLFLKSREIESNQKNMINLISFFKRFGMIMAEEDFYYDFKTMSFYLTKKETNKEIIELLKFLYFYDKTNKFSPYFCFYNKEIVNYITSFKNSESEKEMVSFLEEKPYLTINNEWKEMLNLNFGH